MDPSLSYDQAPPIDVPLRFFLTAPALGVLAGVGLAWVGPAGIYGRWTLEVLALTHLLVLGFATMVMFGALFQMLPVLGGAPVTRARLVASVVHALLLAGVVTLAVGLAHHKPIAIDAAIAALGSAGGLFVVAAAGALLRVPRVTAPVIGMRLAIAALAITATIGLGLAATHAGAHPPHRPLWTDLHAAWGLAGWMVLLVVAVAYQFVPMFQVTPEYPAPVRRALVPVLFVLLAGWSAVRALAAPAIAGHAIGTALAAAVIVFAILTLRLQARRRRRRADVTLACWRTALVALAVASALWVALPWWPPRYAGQGEALVGVLVIVGFAVTLMIGMLHKIVPFLMWFHLQRRALASGREREVPAMGAFLPATAARRHFRVHLAAAVLLSAATLFPLPLARPAGVLTALAFALFEFELLRALGRYRATARALATGDPGPS